MSLDDDIALLRAVPFFDGFGAEELRLIAFGTDPRRLDDGERLVRENAYADGAYVIASGTILLRTRHARGEQRMVRGDMIAPLALVTDIEHRHTALADGPAHVLKISRQLFRRVLEEHPHLAEALANRIKAGFSAMSVELEGMIEPD